MRFPFWLSALTLTAFLMAGPALAVDATPKPAVDAKPKPAVDAKPKPKPKKATSKKKKPAPVVAAPAAPVDNSVSALSSCKKHVENMLKSPATQFQSDSTMKVQKKDAENFDVSGPVSSANQSGKPIGGNFNCHAELIGGAVWSTKTSLDFER